MAARRDMCLQPINCLRHFLSLKTTAKVVDGKATNGTVKVQEKQEEGEEEKDTLYGSPREPQITEMERKEILSRYYLAVLYWPGITLQYCTGQVLPCSIVLTRYYLTALYLYYLALPGSIELH